MIFEKIPIIYLLGGLVVLAMLAPLITALIRGGFPEDRDRRVQDAFEGAAQKLGLLFELRPTGLSAYDYFNQDQQIYLPSHEPQIKGQWRGRTIEGLGKVERLRRNGSEFRHRPRISVGLNDERIKKLRIQPRDKLGRLEKRAVGNMADVDWGQPDTPTGDDKFDADFIIGGLVDDEHLSWLRQPEVKEALRRLDEDPAYLWFEIRLGKLTVEIDFRGLNASELVTTIEAVVDSAQALEEAFVDGRARRRDEETEFFPSF